MEKDKIKERLCAAAERFTIYEGSFRFSADSAFFILKDQEDKYLGIGGPAETVSQAGFGEQVLEDIEDTDGFKIRILKRSNRNAKLLMDKFPQLRPAPLGMETTFGFGDRLGLANAAHLKIIEKQKGILPILAQQSVRELLKTDKDFETVVAQSVWNIMQEGYMGKWGADADHIKSKEYFVKASEAGMTMYTLDTSDHLNEEILDMPDSEIREKYDKDTPYMKEVLKRYEGKKAQFGDQEISFDKDVIIRLALIYGKAMDFAKEIFDFLSSRLDGFDYEVSFDETNTISTPQAHYFIAQEMKNADIDFTSLAFRFPGTFEKGIDYIGDIKEFEKSISTHAEICRSIGGYKLSLHSGSDKISIYPSFAKNTRGVFHIKTSGTSWLESVRLVAMVDPVFFRELYEITRDTFDENKKAYHVNLDKSTLPVSMKDVKDENLPLMLDNPDLRRAFHIAYGEILSRKKAKLMKLLFENEQEHYGCIIKNFDKHFAALKC